MERMKENKLTQFIRLLICIVALLSLNACSSDEEIISPYKVIDSNHDVDPKHIYWMDNERVIFIGRAAPIPSSPVERHKFTPSIYIWNINKGISKYKDVPDISTPMFCFNDGRIVYHLNDVDDDYMTIHRIEGKFGEEKLVIDKRRKKNEPVSKQWSDLTCKYHKIPERLHNRRWHALKEDHGYIDKGAKDSKYIDVPLTYYSDKSSEGRVLPAVWQHAKKIKYYDFKQAYLLSGWMNDDKSIKEKRIQTWWLYPGGKIESLVVPYIDIGGRMRFLPTKDGNFYLGGSWGKKVKKPTHGGYYFFNGQLSKFISGHIETTALSPDGCKLAFSHYPHKNYSVTMGKEFRTLKMVNICTIE
ncbi:MAG: hypothetical protein AAF419_02820 [Pseudomonadota bacterium]